METLKDDDSDDEEEHQPTSFNLNQYQHEKDIVDTEVDEDKYELTSTKKNVYNVKSKNINSNGIRKYHNTAIIERCLKKGDYVLSRVPFVREDEIHYHKRNIYTKNLYSTTNLMVEKDIKLVNTTNNNKLFEDNNDLSEQFLNDTSYFFKEAKSILDSNTTNKKSLQVKLEEYVLNSETELIKEIILNDKDLGKYGEVVNNLNKYCIKPLMKILGDFTHRFEINGYKNLFELIKKEDRSVNFYLLFFVIEYDVERKRMVREKNIENYIENRDLKFIDNLSREN
jgi:hypothetical protein